MKRFLGKIGAAIIAASLLLTGMPAGSKLPVSLQAEAAGASQASISYSSAGMKLSWQKVNGASSYRIERASSRFGNYSYLADVSGTSYTDTSPNRSKYSNYYKITAKNGSATVSEEIISLESQIFGDNMIFFSDDDPASAIDSKVSEIYDIQEKAQFGKGRYALMFKPGDYTDTQDMNVGFYTQIAGLGKLPTEVKLANASTPAFLADNNATCNFWRSIENVSIIDLDNNADVYFAFQWAVSQAAPARRLYVERNAVFDWWYGWASGGYAADCKFVKDAGSYSQQQYYMRNSSIGGNAYGVNWNFVLQGVEGGNLSAGDALLGGNGTSDWASGGKTTQLSNSPAVKEKPFLYLDNDEYKVFVPALRRNARGTSWTMTNMGQGESLSLDSFYVAKEGDKAADINKQLDAGKNILFTPGIYYAEEPIRVTNPGTVVLGYGMATIIPENDQAAMWVEDADGISISGLIFDASSYSKVLLQVGNEDAAGDHSADPITLSDLFFRVGGVYAGVASADMCLVINSDDVIGDHFWIWRADHGDGVSWNENVAKNGIVVNGDDVTVYGLFDEHFEEYSTLWLGNGGKCYFYQYETPYDCTDQNLWKSHNGTKNGYAGYKVGNNVDTHYAVGLDLYEVFINTNGADCRLDTAVEIPNKPGVIVENAMINTFSNTSVTGGIQSIVNGTGTGEKPGVMTTPGIVSAVNGVTTIRPNQNNGDTYHTVRSTQPTDEDFTDKTGIHYVYEKDDSIPVPGPIYGDKLTVVAASASTELQKAANAIDDNMGSRWESAHGQDNQWITLDLGEVKLVDSAKITWETAAGKEYKIQISKDNKNWTDVVTVTNGKSGETLEAEIGGKEARYVRMYGTKRTTQYGYSIYEFELYGTEGTYQPDPDPQPQPGERVDKVEGAFDITSPEHYETVGAGLVNISWDAPAGKNVKNYLVYVNGKEVAQTTDRNAEYYTTGVQYYSLTIRAILDDGSSLDSDTIRFGVTKKGLGLATDMGENLDLDALGLGWYYNWSETKSSGSQYANTEFVPMIWKETSASAAQNRINKLVDQGYDYVLTFNEPDFTDQCNMTVDEVYEAFKGCQDDRILISSPVSAIWPKASTDWFQPFAAKVAADPAMDYDFIAIHCYPEDFGGKAMADWFIDNVVDYTWETYHKPIWITEFSTHGQWVTATGDNGTKEFWEAVMPMLDERDYVVRYAGFDFDDANYGLWRYATGALTPAGEAYRDNGNPVEDGRIYTMPAPIAGNGSGGSGSGGSGLGGSGDQDAVELNVTGYDASTQMQSAANAFDDNAGSRWESTHGLDDQWIMADLGEVKTVSSVEIDWETAAGKDYSIEVSANGDNWTEVYRVDNGKNGDSITADFDSVSARYVRVYGRQRTTQYGYSIFEFRIYGQDGSSQGGGSGSGDNGSGSGGNGSGDQEVVELNVTGYDASTQMQSAANAFDDNAGSRWESTHGLDDQWIMADLGEVKNVSSVSIDWETAAGKDYSIEVSANGDDWSEVYREENGKDGASIIADFDSVSARYVRVYGRQRTTQYGYSIYEMSVYGY
ncbi:discoidin domain-containing protein [Butyrivibrio sp. MC2013]|uniref:discoidin domain-containing protein n=1 Tax=Butyrivibrio sp. MC2013 TaxID=1280686 RepID=UPI0004066BA1|nr:discoidin domain-containing protein [Butyrivibrio sp. MC2013]